MSSGSQTVEPRLPILGTGKAVVRLVAAESRDLVVAITWLLPLYCAAALVSAGSRTPLVDAFALLVSLLVIAIASVAWYRRFLLNEQARLLPRLSRCHLRMCLMALLLSLPTYGPLWIAELFFPTTPTEDLFREVVVLAVVVAVLFLALYLFLRLFMVFPAIALGVTFGLRDAYRASAHNGWRLFLVFLLLAVPSSLLLVAIDLLFEASLDEPNWISLAYGLEGPGIGGLKEVGYVVLQSLIHIVLGVLTTALGAVAFMTLTALAPPSYGVRKEALS